MEKRKEKSDQNAVAELTREGLYKENKWLWEENKKLKAELDATVESKNFYIKKLIEERDYFKKQLYGFTHLDEHK